MTLLKQISIYFVLVFTLTIAMAFSINNVSEVKYHSQKVNIVIKGTSTMHDWEMNSNKGKVELMLDLKNDNIASVSALKFSLEAESLESGKNMMDNNAYKALKTGSAKYITFVLSSAQVTQQEGNSYQVKALGKLTVAGTTRETDVVATVKYNPADKSFVVSGSKKLKMSNYNVKAPTFMMGAVKTGDDITISFNTKIVR